MKTKKFVKNLVLNKTTIAKLNNMNELKGGFTLATCNTCLTPPGGTNCIYCMPDLTEEQLCITINIC